VSPQVSRASRESPSKRALSDFSDEMCFAASFMSDDETIFRFWPSREIKCLKITSAGSRARYSSKVGNAVLFIIIVFIGILSGSVRTHRPEVENTKKTAPRGLK
jgi:amino acid transporter